jgi:hypothetical protein
MDPKTIKIHEETNHNFDAIKNQEISKQDEILDSYLDDEFDNFEDETPIDVSNLQTQQPDSLLNQTLQNEEFTPEVKKKKREMKGLIKRYLDSVFGEYLGEFKTLNLDEMNLAKLEETLEDIEYSVDCHEASAFGRESFSMVLGLGETMLFKNGIKCRGLALKLTQDEKAMRLVDRISLKRRLNLSPEYQLGLMVIGTAYVLHKTNEFKEEHEMNITKKASSEIVNDFNDLDVE